LVDQNVILRNAPHDDGYDIARAVFNGMIDRRPALIARCAAGGHSVPGYAVVEGGVVVDLSPIKGIWVDPEARTAQAGLKWGELDRETQAFGLAVTGVSRSRGRRCSRRLAVAARSGGNGMRGKVKRNARKSCERRFVTLFVTLRRRSVPRIVDKEVR
jgi:hypothetical protein